MPTKKLTDLFVERVKPPTRGRLEYFDASFPGLALRITSNGGKSWSMFYRFGGRLRRFTIGAYPAVKAAQARRETGRQTRGTPGRSHPRPPGKSGKPATGRGKAHATQPPFPRD